MPADGDRPRFLQLSWSSPTAVLLGLNVAVYAAMMLAGGAAELSGPSAGTLMLFGADYGPLVRQGQVHRLVASMFLHVHPIHLLMNCAALVSIGPQVERSHGWVRFVTLYLLAGLAGSIASVVWNLRHPVVSAGASGALCGAIAAGAVAAHVGGERNEVRALLGWLVSTLVLGAVIKADNAAHLGGMVAGGALGWLLRRGPSRPDEQAVAPGGILVAAALVSFAGAAATRDRAETASQLVNRGVERARAGADGDAIAAYERALELEPDDAIAHFDLGLALERQGDLPGAIRHFERALQLEPADDNRRALATAYINHGVTLSERGDTTGAIEAYRRALALDDGDAHAHRNLGLALSRAGELEPAIAELRRAMDLRGDADDASALANALAADGLQLATAGKHAEAIARYREAIALDPGAWHHHLGLGLSLLETRDAASAVTAFEMALALGGGEAAQSALADALEARGDAHADARDIGAALDDLDRATTLRLLRPDAGVQK